MEGQTSAVNLLRVIRQNCILSPLIFKFYSERFFKEVLENTDIGMNNIRYAHHNLVFTDNINNIKELINKIKDVRSSYRLELNIIITKFMVIINDQQCDHS